MKTSTIVLCLLAAVLPLAGCSGGKKSTADPVPTEKDMEAVRVFFIQEWNAKFVECNDYFYSRSDTPYRIFLGMKTHPSKFTYEWTPLSGTDRVRGVRMRCTVYITTELSMVHADGSWLRPFKKGSGFLIASDLFHQYIGTESRETRNEFLERKCIQFKECIGFNITVNADGSMAVSDDGDYWDHLIRPENCGEIPE